MEKNFGKFIKHEAINSFLKWVRTFQNYTQKLDISQRTSIMRCHKTFLGATIKKTKIQVGWITDPNKLYIFPSGWESTYSLCNYKKEWESSLHSNMNKYQKYIVTFLKNQGYRTMYTVCFYLCKKYVEGYIYVLFVFSWVLYILPTLETSYLFISY